MIFILNPNYRVKFLRELVVLQNENNTGEQVPRSHTNRKETDSYKPQKRPCLFTMS